MEYMVEMVLNCVFRNLRYFCEMFWDICWGVECVGQVLDYFFFFYVNKCSFIFVFIYQGLRFFEVLLQVVVELYIFQGLGGERQF